jgi:heterodisulfide reductase subunit B
MKYAYYPGCSLEATGKEYNMSTEEVFEALGIELKELKDWNCCGATAASSVNNLLSIALPARNLAIAEKMGLDVVAPCSECFNKLRKADHVIKEESGMRDKVERSFEGTGLSYGGSVDVKHPLDVIANEFGLDKLREMVQKSLSGMKVAPYYGCVVVKPPEVTSFDSPEDPKSMDLIIEALGAQSVDFDGFKTKCCGGPVLITKEEIALGLTSDILEKAKAEGADLVVTPCPLCHMMLDAKQATSLEGTKIPVLYFTQLIGLALGIDPKKLGLDKNLVSTEKVLEGVQ